MDNLNETLAQKVVEAFKQNISAEARGHISEAEFNRLALIVQEALSLEMAEAVEMVDNLEKRLKEMVEHPEFGL
jgi:hypothetical protein